jgi:hypothetical protein
VSDGACRLPSFFTAVFIPPKNLSTILHRIICITSGAGSLGCVSHDLELQVADPRQLHLRVTSGVRIRDYTHCQNFCPIRWNKTVTPGLDPGSRFWIPAPAQDACPGLAGMTIERLVAERSLGSQFRFAKRTLFLAAALIFLLYVGQGFIDCFQCKFQVFFTVPKADV